MSSDRHRIFPQKAEKVHSKCKERPKPPHKWVPLLHFAFAFELHSVIVRASTGTRCLLRFCSLRNCDWLQSCLRRSLAPTIVWWDRPARNCTSTAPRCRSTGFMGHGWLLGRCCETLSLALVTVTAGRWLWRARVARSQSSRPMVPTPSLRQRYDQAHLSTHPAHVYVPVSATSTPQPLQMRRHRCMSLTTPLSVQLFADLRRNFAVRAGGCARERVVE